LTSSTPRCSPSIGRKGDELIDFDRHVDAIAQQATLFARHLAGADVTVSVPSCPGWNVSQLSRHVEGGLRWARQIVATAATEAPPDTALRDLSTAAQEDSTELAEAIRDAAASLVDTLRMAGPAAQMWCPVAGGGSAFYARRFAQETAVHRADAAIALGLPFTLDPDVASDGVEEWLELGSLPFHFDVHPWMRDLLGPGRIIGLNAVDTGEHWLLDLTGDAIAWRRGDDPASAALRGTLTALLLVLYRRRPVATLDVIGDADLVDFWLDRVAFG
jgi:uncharacterized protein (TIGR03083 family)